MSEETLKRWDDALIKFLENRGIECVKFTDNHMVIKIVNDDLIALKYHPESQILKINTSLTMQKDVKSYDKQLRVLTDVAFILGAISADGNYVITHQEQGDE